MADISDIDLDAIVAQRAEARGDDGTTASFRFKEQHWTFRDPMLLDDSAKDELAEIEHDVDIAAWYMGDEQYDKFVAVGGNSSLFFMAFRAHMDNEKESSAAGKPTRPNRSSRRAASKQPKRR